MLVRTDDEVYRVDSVWLGPPRATFPWRARYVSYGVGLLVMILIMFLQRRIGMGLEFFSVAWALVLTVLITRFLGKRIDYERPLGQVAELFKHEVLGPRRRRAPGGGPVRFGHVRARRTLPARISRARRAAAAVDGAARPEVGGAARPELGAAVRPEAVAWPVATSRVPVDTDGLPADGAPADGVPVDAGPAEVAAVVADVRAAHRSAEPLRDITPVRVRGRRPASQPWATAAERSKGERRGGA